MAFFWISFSFLACWAACLASSSSFSFSKRAASSSASRACRTHPNRIWQLEVHLCSHCSIAGEQFTHPTSAEFSSEVIDNIHLWQKNCLIPIIWDSRFEWKKSLLAHHRGVRQTINFFPNSLLAIKMTEVFLHQRHQCFGSTVQTLKALSITVNEGHLLFPSPPALASWRQL